MASSEYSQTLQNITDAKLEELSLKRQIFLERKASAIDAAESTASPIAKIRALADGVKSCFNIPIKDGRVIIRSGNHRQLEIDLANLDRFLQQADYDPAISPDMIERWHRTLLRYLDIHTLKYEYATLFAQLTKEWLSVKKNQSSQSHVGSQGDFEKIASTTKMESRQSWEETVFTAAGHDAEVITAFLTELFSGLGPPGPEGETGQARGVDKTLQELRARVGNCGLHVSAPLVKPTTLTWVIDGLLNSDLMSGKQQTALREFTKDDTVLSELCDVINMRLARLDAWTWGPAVHVEQRRQMNGTYHMHMHEDLIQAIFLQYIGVMWSKSFKTAIREFRAKRDNWKSRRSQIPATDKKRLEFFSYGKYNEIPSLQTTKETIHREAYFVSQLPESEYEIRKHDEGELEASSCVKANRPRAKQTAPRPRPGTRAMAYRKIAPSAAAAAEETEESDEDMGFRLYDDDPSDEPDANYTDIYGSSMKSPANQSKAKQNLLLLLSADTIINKRLHGEITCFRAQYESLYPSLPHSTILAVLRFFGVSEKWLSFFEKFLAAPLKFMDEPQAEPRMRRRGTPGSHALSELFGETTLFCLDLMINKETDGEILWRVNDDMWFWSRDQETSVAAWKAIQRFNEKMGISIGEDTCGGAHITTEKKKRDSTIHPVLPKGKIRWGMLYLNPESGNFEIDQDMVDEHIKELQRQLDDKQGSIFGWIQAWNSYASTFFSYNFGVPANCLGQRHVDTMLKTHERIQREIFSSGPGGSQGDSSVITHLREMIQSRFGTVNLPDGYFFLPIDLGGLELSSPFITLVALRDSVVTDPDSLLDDFLEAEKRDYANHKRWFDAKDKLSAEFRERWRPEDADQFMSFEEYTRYREYLNYRGRTNLVEVYDKLLKLPQLEDIKQDVSGPVTLALGQLQGQNNLSGVQSDWYMMSSYWRWLAQLYGPEIVERFGGFNIVDPGLLPIGLVSQFRSGRVSWAEE
ncbi:hypothetical protein N7539_008077 [Penicillium diatomitis]|uniref:Reverse transcriptase domain-containing protein n=1 Tax=Penicillium diatomitis TaxID=2819901 RepID=A0A9W9WT37_9EURO|nr:uncharacterized protein N7539_008077 [Penicillium diatomitis]KAJ5475011.1 hypothetical protein N7539_008077 [Penicillium diatomitis]